MVEYGTRITRKSSEGTAFPVYGGGGETFRTGTFNREDRLVVARFGMSQECARVVAGKFFLNDSGLTLLPRNPTDLLPEFLNWLIIARQPEIYALARGSAQKNLDVRAFRQWAINYPQPPEQERIVAVLDEAFEAIATATANTEKNLTNARELFESEVDSLLAYDRSWSDTVLKAEIDLLPGLAFKSAKFTDRPNDTRLLRGDNIVPGGLRWKDVKRWPLDDATDVSRFTLHANDVVLAMDRPWVNAGLKRAYMRKGDLPCLLVQRVARLRSLADLDPRYLYHLIGSRTFIAHIVGDQTGTGVPHISGKQILAFSFLKPPLDRQKAIGAKIDELYEMTSTLSACLSLRIERLTDLRQSILQKAFSGELTAVDRELSDAGI